MKTQGRKVEGEGVIVEDFECPQSFPASEKSVTCLDG